MPGWEYTGAVTGLWSESAAGRGSCGPLGLLSTPKEEGAFSHVPASSPSRNRHLPWVFWAGV